MKNKNYLIVEKLFDNTEKTYHINVHKNKIL